MLASSAARASAALRNLTAADSALDMQRSALAAFSVEHADSVSARRARLDTLAQCRRAVADATDRATQAQQRADAIDVQRQQHATSDAMARAELQRHRSKAAAAETDAKAAVDEAAAIEDGLVALAAAVETAREKQAHIHSLLNMLDDIAGTGAAGDGSAKAVSQLAEMDAQIAAKRAEVQRANEKISQNERSQQKHDQQKALHERKLAKGASGSGEPSAEDPVLRNFQKLIAGKRVALQTAVDEAERSLARLLDVRQSMAADDRMAQDSAALRATLDANLTAASGEFAAAHTAHAVAQSRLTVVAQRQSSARAALADAQSAIAQTTARIEAIEAETRRHERDAAAIAASQTEADAALAAAVAAEQRAAVDAREFDADVSEYDELVRQRQREIASAALHGETLRKAAFDVLFDAGQRRHFEALRQLQQQVQACGRHGALILIFIVCFRLTCFDAIPYSSCVFVGARDSQVTSSVTEHAALGRDVDAAWSRAQQSQARVAEATKLLKAA